MAHEGVAHHPHPVIDFCGVMSLTDRSRSELSARNQVSFKENAFGLIDIEGGEFDALIHEVLKNLSACEIIEIVRY